MTKWSLWKTCVQALIIVEVCGLMMENLVYWKAFEWDVLENKYGRSKLEREEFESILKWAEEIKIALNESLNEEIFEESKSSSTLDEIGFLEGHMDFYLNELFGEENNLVYDEKEGMDFVTKVGQDMEVNIVGHRKECFRLDACKDYGRSKVAHEIKCESLKRGLAYERGRKDQLEDKGNSLDEKENDAIENLGKQLNEGELGVCEKSKFLTSLECQVKELMKENFELMSRKAVCSVIERILEFRNQELELLCGEYLAKLNEQEVVLKEDSRILEDKSEVKGKELLQLVRELESARNDFDEKIGEGKGLMLENEELDSMCKEYLLRLEQLRVEIKLKGNT